MRTIKAVPITAENFRVYGSFVNMLLPEGHCFPGDATFYPDPLTLNVRNGAPVAFSPLTVKKPERMIVSQAEYHDLSGEGAAAAQRAAARDDRAARAHLCQRLYRGGLPGGPVGGDRRR